MSYLLVVDNSDMYYSEDTTWFDTYGQMVDYCIEKPNLDIVGAYEVTRTIDPSEIQNAKLAVWDAQRKAKTAALAKLTLEDRKVLGL